ncbi:DNA methyltransferase [Thiomonas sp. OC7]|uniref:class I SAM-dependent DNA methyltransferase n=1 Tax=Thiomonas sp. OC7 TaxID=2493107 RepID=UPI0012A7C549|nr:DNA methyltransferase [Thiomonas sp. OC7]VDY12142.1 Putative DNA methyltransferase YeeA (modular protein) [Thiomonas sp. OC7]
MNLKKFTLAAALAALPLLASAQTYPAPAPTPDPTAQQSLGASANQNSTSAYNGGMSYYNQQAYQAASNTAQDISNQDASNSGSGYDGIGTSDAWQQAADQAQSVANDNQAQAGAQIPVQQQAATSQSASYNAEVSAAPAVAQSNNSAAQSAASSGAAQSTASITQSTGVQQGQPTVTNNTGEYLIAGAATQAAMNGLTTTGFTANKAAYQDAQNAASCGNPWCAAGWMAANAVEQNIANGAYAANVAAAPVLGTALNVAAAASALNSAKGTRRELGAHYTSERNILRVLGPLCMDDLRDEFAAARHSKPRLQALYDKLPTLTFIDPACGCGNFLVIAYRELRRLENEVIELLFSKGGQTRGLLDVSTLSRLRVSQFHGIEIDESAAHIARVALWITDHQMNLEAAERFGTTRPTVPLVDSPHIHHANALRTDWAEVLPPEQCSYVLGNPPFVGKSNQNAEQKADMARVFAKVKGAGVLDFVAAWYVKAAAYIQRNPAIDVAFVSTNSITQGEQVAALWPTLLQARVKIRFAHRTFQWSNEGKGIAAVHCVIIGFGLREPQHCTLFDYGDDIKGDGQRITAKCINPYLVDAPDVVMTSRRTPIQNVPEMAFGSMPNDGGYLLLTPEERAALLDTEPQAEKWIHQYLGADEFINKLPRYCLWMVGISPAELRAMPEVYRRVQAVKAVRLKSTRPTTQELAATPYLFGENRQPDTPYLLVPSVSSERREFVPIGFMPPEVIASNLVLTIPGATLYHFALLNSTLHNAWLRAVGGRLESRYRYSASIVYNNFPWPEPTAAQREAIEAAGQAILDARARYPDATLADLYDPLTMPAELRRAHQANDRAVDAAYGYKGDRADAPRVAFLFSLYQRLTSLLPPPKKQDRREVAI